MSIFFRLKGKVYKTSNNVTIGRGTPFEDLDDNREISRNHCKLIKKKENFYIKSTDENSKLLVNGKRIPPGNFVKVNCDSKLHLADLELELLSSYEKKDYISIKRFYSPEASVSKLGLMKTGLLYSAGLFIFSSISFDKFELVNVIWKLIASLLMGFFLSFLIKIMGNVFGKRDELLVNEVIVGRSGLTLHYRKKNISIFFSDIEQVYKNPIAIYIHAHNEIFQINELRDFDKLYALIIKFVPKSSKNIITNGATQSHAAL